MEMEKQTNPPPYSPPQEQMHPNGFYNQPTSNPPNFQYAPLYVSSPPPPAPPPGPSSVVNVAVNSGGVRAGCPVCGNKDFTGTYPCHAWLCCLLCSWAFCFGCIWCLCMRRKKCTKCGFQAN